MKEKYYAITLEDYSVPAYVSSTKEYFGTLDEITAFINSLRHDEYHKGLVEAFDKYCEGDINVKHYVAYNNYQLMHPVSLIATFEHELSETDYDHINIWGCPYYMRFKKAKMKHYWFKLGKDYYRCLKVIFEELQYQSRSGNWFCQEEGYWGHPYMLTFKPPHTYNNLAVIEKIFCSVEEFNQDGEKFNPEEDYDLTGFFNEIFGNG